MSGPEPAAPDVDGGEDGATAPPLRGAEAFALVWATGVGAVLAYGGLLGIALTLGALGFMRLLSSRDRSGLDVVLVFALCAVALGVGVAVRRRLNGAHYVGAAGGLLVAAATAIRASSGSNVGWGPVALGLACIPLALPAVARWFTSEGRARAAEVPALPLGAAALDWGGAYLALFLGPGTALLGTMKRMFDETGIRLGWTTELVFEVVFVLREYGYLLVPTAAALVAILLVKGPATPRKWVLGVHALGAGLFVGVLASLILPIVGLVQKL